jgi:hypothetical protein
MTLAHSAGTGRHALTARKDDLYETPPEATLALLACEDIPQRVWEPACGPGAIVRVLRESGREVVAGDLVDYGCPMSVSHVDFLMEWRAPHKLECIVTNPPFKLAAAFVSKAIELCPRVYMLLRLEFLETERRSPILDNGQLARVHVFARRLPMMHRAGWSGPRSTSRIAFAWFVWDRHHAGPTELRRISWSKQVHR